jgi:hypothetical protein
MILRGGRGFGGLRAESFKIADHQHSLKDFILP